MIQFATNGLKGMYILKQLKHKALSTRGVQPDLTDVFNLHNRLITSGV